ncbi:ANTAR domain-containing protein [Arthrobacter sp. MSA 4-2]|uniref:ANTAR domain-containing protein n=1 Tax=Arthrobacter sp. MSA 4-2 TaxID=2794349 RepID=UPI0018E6DCF7|nr:ANTAR domain-containing protein [Arthrobacter sp. MSA 4-2]MBJ2121466.1 ANTAR domain-containing protein [Arthrobacter sp. MSA 4-2]
MRAHWRRLLTGGGPVAGYHSIIDRRGNRHWVLSVGDLMIDAGIAVGVQGMVTDLTRPMNESLHRAADEAVAGSAARRAVIEQAKGVLMGRHGISAEEAFNALSTHSQNNNRRVTDLAQDLVDAVTGQGSKRAATGPNDQVESLLRPRTDP